MPRSSPQTDRVMAIVNLLTARADRGATLSEIATELGQTPATYVHVLASLAAGGFVVRSPSDRRYHVGPALIAPGQAAAGRFPSLTAARSAIEDLSADLGYSVFAFSHDGDYARLVEAMWDVRHPAPGVRIGDLLPIEPPLGAVFVAWSSAAEIDAWLDRGPSSLVTRAALADRLGAARAQGFVVELRAAPPLLHELVRLVGRGQQMRRAERIHGSVVGVEQYLAEPIDPDASYDLSTISIPVIASDGLVPMALNLFGFDEPIAGHEILRLGSTARRVADRLAEQMRSVSPD